MPAPKKWVVLKGTTVEGEHFVAVEEWGGPTEIRQVLFFCAPNKKTRDARVRDFERIVQAVNGRPPESTDEARERGEEWVLMCPYCLASKQDGHDAARCDRPGARRAS